MRSCGCAPRSPPSKRKRDGLQDDCLEIHKAKCDALLRNYKLEAEIAALTENLAQCEAVGIFWCQKWARVTEQRDRAMKVVEAAQAWAIERHDATGLMSASIAEAILLNAVVGFNSLAALDAEAAAETAPKP
jgi:hypothetical protein